MRLAPDTNILVYAEGLHDAIKQKAALDLLDALPRSAVALPAQVAAELFQVLAQRAQRTPAQARSAMLTWCDAFDIVETPHSVLLGAADLHHSQTSSPRYPPRRSALVAAPPLTAQLAQPVISSEATESLFPSLAFAAMF